jgi:hypothetical protein
MNMWPEPSELAIRAQLGERFEREWKAGEALTIEDAVALALGEQR